MQTIAFVFSWLYCMQHCKLAPKRIVCNARVEHSKNHAYQRRDNYSSNRRSPARLRRPKGTSRFSLEVTPTDIKFSRERMVQQHQQMDVIQKRPGDDGIASAIRPARRMTAILHAFNWSMFPAYTSLSRTALLSAGCLLCLDTTIVAQCNIMLNACPLYRKCVSTG
jgi:hypothetical protein